MTGRGTMKIPCPHCGEALAIPVTFTVGRFTDDGDGAVSFPFDATVDPAGEELLREHLTEHHPTRSEQEGTAP